MQVKDLSTPDMLRLIAAVCPTLSVTRALPGVPPKVVERKLEKLADQGLIEYSTTINRPWLTDAGRAVIGLG